MPVSVWPDWNVPLGLLSNFISQEVTILDSIYLNLHSRTDSVNDSLLRVWIRRKTGKAVLWIASWFLVTLQLLFRVFFVEKLLLFLESSVHWSRRLVTRQFFLFC